MSGVKTAFNGERLKSARLYNSLTIADVAEKTGLSKQAISQFETKKIEPKLETLMKLISVLGFPREYFYEECKDEVIIGDTYFRSLSTTTNKERMAQIEKVKLLVGIYRLIQEYISFPTLNIYKVPDDFEMDIEKLAISVRKFWGLKQEPIFNLIDIMEKNGILISSVFTNTNNIEAYSQIEQVNGNPIAVVILGSDKDNAFRRNFSAAHELGHLILDDFYNVNDLEKLEYKAMEDVMNQFAEALLIPKETYIKDLNTSSKTDLNFYIQMKRKYRVSIVALIVRAKKLNQITLNQYQYLMKQLSQNGYRSCEPFDKETPTIKPRYLKQAIKMIIEEDEITGREFIEELSYCKNLTLNSKIIEEILCLDEGYLKYNDKSESVIELKKRLYYDYN